MIARVGRWSWGLVLGSLLGLVLGSVLPLVGRDLARTRPALATFTRLVALANAGDRDAVQSLCTAAYQARHPIEAAPGGGVVGLPRQIHPNYQIWMHGDEVWLCPANRVGTVYRLVSVRHLWRLDGVAGLLGGDGQVTPFTEDDQRDAAAARPDPAEKP